jgi:hypothetical protein
MKNVRMFCGEFNGELEPGHIGFRADTVRHHISYLYSALVPLADMYNRKVLWVAARKAGWRVVPVKVERCKRMKDTSNTWTRLIAANDQATQAND